jgi:hypothetical protein
MVALPAVGVVVQVGVEVGVAELVAQVQYMKNYC